MEKKAINELISLEHKTSLLKKYTKINDTFRSEEKCNLSKQVTKIFLKIYLTIFSLY